MSHSFSTEQGGCRNFQQNKSHRWITTKPSHAVGGALDTGRHLASDQCDGVGVPASCMPLSLLSRAVQLKEVKFTELAGSCGTVLSDARG